MSESFLTEDDIQIIKRTDFGTPHSGRANIHKKGYKEFRRFEVYCEKELKFKLGVNIYRKYKNENDLEEVKKELHENILKNLSQILEWKIHFQERFGNLDKVLEYLSPEDQEKALFHLDVLK